MRYAPAVTVLLRNFHGVKEPRRRSAKILTQELYQTGFIKTFFLASDDYLDQQETLILVKSEGIR
jgi:hypothetical protein